MPDVSEMLAELLFLRDRLVEATGSFDIRVPRFTRILINLESVELVEALLVSG